MISADFPRNWYWVVGADTTQVYSSKQSIYVSTADAGYIAWLANNAPTRIASEVELGEVLAQHDIRPVAATLLDAFLTNKVTKMDAVQFKILFNHENRVRVLEGKAAMTVAQFVTVVKALL
jgi:hypothetical protein